MYPLSESRVPAPKIAAEAPNATSTFVQSKVKAMPRSEIAMPGRVILFGNLRSRRSITISGMVVAAKKPTPSSGNILQN